MQISRDSHHQIQRSSSAQTTYPAQKDTLTRDSYQPDWQSRLDTYSVATGTILGAAAGVLLNLGDSAPVSPWLGVPAGLAAGWFGAGMSSYALGHDPGTQQGAGMLGALAGATAGLTGFGSSVVNGAMIGSALGAFSGGLVSYGVAKAFSD